MTTTPTPTAAPDTSLSAAEIENARLRTEERQARQALGAIVLDAGGKVHISHRALAAVPREPAFTSYDEENGMVVELRKEDDDVH